MSASRTSAAVLAGGRARRFGGRDKSRLLIEGRSIIVRQLEILQRVAGEVFAVGADADRFADLNITVHPDRQPNLGALGGLYTALDVASRENVIVVACDLPFLSEALLTELVRRAESASADGAWVRTSRGPEPLIACYRRAARGKVLGEIDGGRLTARALGSVLRMSEIDQAELVQFGSPDDLVANINTPADYARVQYRRR